MTRHTIAVGLGKVSVLFVLAATSASGQESSVSSKISLQLGVENPVARVGAPVYIKLLWKNLTSDTLRISSNWLEPNQLKVVDDHGRQDAIRQDNHAKCA